VRPVGGVKEALAFTAPFTHDHANDRTREGEPLANAGRCLFRVVVAAVLLHAAGAAQAASPATTPASSNKPPWWPARHAEEVARAE